MPQMLFSLTDEDYADFKGPHRSEKLRALLKEKREHKCPKTKPEGTVRARYGSKKSDVVELALNEKTGEYEPV